jgi:solute carrier family 25 (mitochondrial phosphate transporter), member 3
MIMIMAAGALATFIACLGVCPAEAVRIRMVAQSRPFGETVTGILDEEGIASLYDGFPPLLIRQVGGLNLWRD